MHQTPAIVNPSCVISSFRLAYNFCVVYCCNSGDNPTSRIKLLKISSRTYPPANFNTRNPVSTCHLLFGAYRSAAINIWVVIACLNSVSAISRNARSSRIKGRTLSELIRAKERSSARLRMEMSGSRRHSRIVFRWRWTALGSRETTLFSVFNATYLS